MQGDTATGQRPAEAVLIRRLEQPGAEHAMHIDRGSDDDASQRIDVVGHDESCSTSARHRHHFGATLTVIMRTGGIRGSVEGVGGCCLD